MDETIKMKKEELFRNAMQKSEEIDTLQKEGIEHFNEGITCLAYYQFSNTQQINPNSFNISPALLKLDKDFNLVSDVPQFSLEPEFTGTGWCDMTPEEYQYETELFLKQNLKHSTLTLMGADENNKVLLKVKEEFTKSLEQYIKLAKEMQGQQ